jgi:DNA invertase Pin-like site-specific DNA recombinase
LLGAGSVSRRQSPIRRDLAGAVGLASCSRPRNPPKSRRSDELDSYGVAFHSYTESHLATDNELVRNILLAVMSSLAKAVAKGKKLGRKPVASEIETQVRKMRAEGIGMLKIAEKLRIGSSTVQRIVREAHD